MDLKGYKFTGENLLAERKKFRTAKCNDKSLCENREEAELKMKENLKEILDLQEKLYAEKTEGIMFVFQAMDAAGKDGTIRSVFSVLSPHGLREAAFKQPSVVDISHDFLWRIHKETPAKGEIVIFNRSHYEDVLTGKVHKFYNDQKWAKRIKKSEIIKNRYTDILTFEDYLFRNSIRTVKIFLNVSKEEQMNRLQRRIARADKNWKFSENDFKEREYWDQYQKAYEECILKTATPDSPWYVVPADNKWYMRYIVSEIVKQTLKEMNPNYPKLTTEEKELLEKYRIVEIADEIKDKELVSKIPSEEEIEDELICVRREALYSKTENIDTLTDDEIKEIVKKAYKPLKKKYGKKLVKKIIKHSEALKDLPENNKEEIVVEEIVNEVESVEIPETNIEEVVSHKEERISEKAEIVEKIEENATEIIEKTTVEIEALVEE